MNFAFLRRTVTKIGEEKIVGMGVRVIDETVGTYVRMWAYIIGGAVITLAVLVGTLAYWVFF